MNIRTLIRQNRNLSARIAELESEFTAYKRATDLAYKGSEQESRDHISELTEQVKVARSMLLRCKPLAAYGRPGTRDVEQAEFQQAIETALAKLQGASQTEELDEGHPLWCVNEQIKGLLEGHGASEDHDYVLKFFRSFGFPETTVKRIHEAICCSRDTERLNVIERKGLHVCADAGFDEDITYQVFEMTGNRNDREWNLIGRGETLREAIDNARKGLK